MVTGIVNELKNVLTADGLVEEKNIIQVISEDDLQKIITGESFPVVGFDIKYTGRNKNNQKTYALQCFIANITSSSEDCVLDAIELNSAIADIICNNIVYGVHSMCDSVRERDNDKDYTVVLDSVTVECVY